MDPRDYILAGTLALLLVVVIAALFSLVRSRKRRRLASANPPLPQGQLPDRPIERDSDTIPDGPGIELSEDGPSAALLTPLHTEAWMPPETPAPTDWLPEASLAKRIETYQDGEPAWAGAVPVLTGEESLVVPSAFPSVTEVGPEVPAALSVPMPDPFAVLGAEEPVRALWSEPVDQHRELPLVLAPGVERPPVVIHESRPALEPEPAAPTEVQTTPGARQRPRAVVRPADAHQPPDPAAVHLAPLATLAVGEATRDRDATPAFSLAAPIEIWFGEHRVGVKRGTKTYEQFRRYADVLFGDLRSADNT